jgi:quercetin dioxygenase-like cupin family protein
MNPADYPELIRNLPQADIPFPGVKAWIAQGADHQVVFFDIPAGTEVPLHSHGAQWGIAVEGEMELTIGEETRVYRAGDSYYIPAGVMHGAKVLTRFRAIDFFDVPDRYPAKAD